MKIEKEISDLRQLESWIPKLALLLDGQSVITLEGDLGAGKTTMVKLLCEYWGVDEVVSSPTYSLVHIYHTADSKEVNHLDLYRIETVEEALDAGVEDYLFSGGITLIEWPAVIESLLPQEVCRIRITQEGKEGRKIVFLTGDYSADE